MDADLQEYRLNTKDLIARNTMTRLDFYGIDAIGLRTRDELLPGRLIVIEGTDGVGRSTQTKLAASLVGK